MLRELDKRWRAKSELTIQSVSVAMQECYKFELNLLCFCWFVKVCNLFCVLCYLQLSYFCKSFTAASISGPSAVVLFNAFSCKPALPHVATLRNWRPTAFVNCDKARLQKIFFFAFAFAGDVVVLNFMRRAWYGANDINCFCIGIGIGIGIGIYIHIYIDMCSYPKLALANAYARSIPQSLTLLALFVNVGTAVKKCRCYGYTKQITLDFQKTTDGTKQPFIEFKPSQHMPKPKNGKFGW